jgi:hypothetical protein
MIVRKIALIGLCAALAACGSEPAEETPAATETAAPLDGAAGTAAAGAGAMQPAPEGLPSRIAGEVITASGQSCAEVSSAERGADGTITATCSGGESYQVYTDAAQGPVAVAR